MSILWDPEPGLCSECGKHSKNVRKYTNNKVCYSFCHECWNREEEGYLIISPDWTEKEAIIFRLRKVS